jgi:hypothetical protein
LVKVLEFMDKTNGNGLGLKSRTRLADWEEYGEIISQIMGNKPNEFLNAYRANREKKTEVIIEETPVAQALLIFMTESNLKEIVGKNGLGSYTKASNGDLEWNGSPSQLLSALTAKAVDDLKIDTSRPGLWAKAPNILSKKLTHVASSLKGIGITITKGHDETKQRNVKIVRTFSVKQEKQPSQSSPSSVTSDMSVKNGNYGDDSTITVSSLVTVLSSPDPQSSPESSPENNENHAQVTSDMDTGDDGDGSDDRISNFTENTGIYECN